MELSTTSAEGYETDTREIRVFISSTFRDMHKEREELVKRTFPQLRKMCEERGVVWSEVDLRWGISDEQSAEGKVLPICLEEIKRCRPYFIGILGDRYGWVPETFPEDLVAREPWLSHNRESSVTELEILHGVLNNPREATHAFFYFRDSTRADGKTMEYPESATLEEIQQYGKDEAERRAQHRRDKLAALKELIRKSKFPVQEYSDPAEFGELVLKDFTRVIEGRFPQQEVPDALERERRAHEIFAMSRYSTRKEGVYVWRQADFGRLDAHVEGDGLPLVILGESGAGKSALIAHWMMRNQERLKAQPQEEKKGFLSLIRSRLNLSRPPPKKAHVIAHFIGATEDSTDWAAMLRRLIGEFNRLFDLTVEIPDTPDALRKAFVDVLWEVDARGRVILIIDALNQLDDRDGAPDLVWLPPEIPTNVRLIVSTLPGRSLSNLKERNWPSFTIEPLAIDEKRDLINNYLRYYRKTLPADSVQKIAAVDATNNPLYLVALLKEMRLYGDHDTLLRKIDSYLEAKTVPELFSKILERYEEDYEGGRPGLVRDTFSYIWASRKGLSETELLQLLGSKEDPLPRAHWSPLFLAAEHNLINRSGYLGFYHDYFREAVQERYLKSDQEQVLAHLTLAEYFTRGNLRRLCEESPWQLARGKAWDDLVSLLTHPTIFSALWILNAYDAREYWAQVESNSAFTMVSAYRPVLDAPDEYDDMYLRSLSSLLAGVGHVSEASQLSTCLTEYYRRSGDQKNLLKSLRHQAIVLLFGGDQDGALALFKEQEQICLEHGLKDNLPEPLEGQASILKEKGDLDGAMALLKRQEQICQESGLKDGLQRSFAEQAEILGLKGDSGGAIALFKESERICRELGLKDSLQASLGRQAKFLQRIGDLDGALALYKEQEQICRELGVKENLQTSLAIQALVLMRKGDLDGALGLFKEAEQICRELGLKDDLKFSLDAHACILVSKGNPDEALALHKEVEQICQDLGSKEWLQKSLGFQAYILKTKGDLDKAMTLYREQEQICREVRLIGDLQESLGSQADLLRDIGDLDGAMTLYKEQEQICRENRLNNGLLTCLEGQAGILETRGDLDEALTHLKESERICRELELEEDLQRLLGAQASILYDLAGALQDQRDLDGALTLFEEGKRIYRELGSKKLVSGCIWRQAIILQEKGDLDAALALFREQEQICREIGWKEHLQVSLRYQATILQSRGDLNGTMKLLKEQEQLCRELGSKEHLQECLIQQASVLQARGDLKGTMKLLKEQGQICRELGWKEELQMSLGRQGVILMDLRDMNGAMALFKEEEQICREIGLKEGLLASLWQQAIILQEKKDLDRAMKVLKEYEQVCRELGWNEELQRSLGSQGTILRDRGDVDGAMRLLKEQEQICRENGLKEGLLASLWQQVIILHDRDDHNKVMEFLKEAEQICRELGLKKELEMTLKLKKLILDA